MSWTHEVRNVLQDHEGRFLSAHDLHDVEEQGPSRLVAKAKLAARLREGLAWETRAQYVMVRHQSRNRFGRAVGSVGVSGDLANVSN